MAILNERVSSPKQLARALDLPVNNVSYHVEKLEELDCIELVESRPVSSGRVIEHFYKATRPPLIDADEWDELSPEEKHQSVNVIVRLISDDVNAAMRSGTFLDPDDNHLSRTPLTVDRQGWDDTVSILDDIVRRLLLVQEESRGRIKAAAKAKREAYEVLETRVAVVHFRAAGAGGPS
jgi:hypothetical protein